MSEADHKTTGMLTCVAHSKAVRHVQRGSFVSQLIPVGMCVGTVDQVNLMSEGCYGLDRSVVKNPALKYKRNHCYMLKNCF